MRRFQLYLFASFALAACGGSSSSSGTETDSGSSSDSESTSSDTNPTTGNSGGQACVPGMSIGCACPDGSMAAQVCNPDGKSYGACGCDGGSASDTNGMTSGTVTTGVTSDATTGSMTTGPMTTDPMTSGVMTTGPMTTGPDTTGGMGGCVDPGPEPNEMANAAVDLGEQTCQDDAKTLMGVLDGDMDVDWFTYHGAWIDQCGQTDPTVMSTLTASDSVRMCVFADCDNSNAVFMCGQAMMVMGPNNTPGCCAMGSISYVVNCAMNPDESAQIYIRLDQAPADSCVDYSIEYSYKPM